MIPVQTCRKLFFAEADACRWYGRTNLCLFLCWFNHIHSDPLNHSPSCRMDKQKGGHFSSFDFIGGEDSGEDSDELYDSDQISEMEEFAGSFHEGGYSDSHDDTNYAQSKDEEDEGVGLIISHDDDDRQTSRAAPPTPLSGGGGDHGFNRNSGRAPASSLRSRGVQKMGRNIGKAVGGGISKVGNVGRSILHVGKSQVHNNGHAKAPVSSSGSSEPDPGAASLLAAGFSFSSESQMSRNYVCGYLHKISDGKWSKRSWHRRWFVLDRQNGILSYYRHNPANLISAAPHGNIVHMEGEDDDGTDAAPLSPAMVAHSSGPSDAGGAPRRSIGRDEVSSARDTSATAKSSPESEQQEKQQQNVLYLCKSHPWYRGEFDLNVDNVSLLFEKSFAKSAPTSYFFQVSTLSLHEIDSKRGVQYKVRLLMGQIYSVDVACMVSNTCCLSLSVVRRQ